MFLTNGLTLPYPINLWKIWIYRQLENIGFFWQTEPRKRNDPEKGNAKLLRYSSSFVPPFLNKKRLQNFGASKIDLPKTESRSLEFLEKDQVDRLVTAADTSKEEGLRDRAIMELLFSTGLRVSELVKLNTDQINFERHKFGVIGRGGRGAF